MEGHTWETIPEDMKGQGKFCKGLSRVAGATT